MTEARSKRRVLPLIFIVNFETFFFFCYQRTETNAKQTVRFNSRQIICLEQSLLRLL